MYDNARDRAMRIVEERQEARYQASYLRRTKGDLAYPQVTDPDDPRFDFTWDDVLGGWQ